MTRAAAARQAAKLERLAGGSDPEARSAEAQAAKLIDQHSLTRDEVEAGRRAELFDDLAGKLGARARRGGLPGPVLAVLEKLKHVDEAAKAGAVGKIKSGLDLAVFMLGDGGACGEIREIFEDACRTHGVTIT